MTILTERLMQKVKEDFIFEYIQIYMYSKNAIFKYIPTIHNKKYLILL